MLHTRSVPIYLHLKKMSGTQLLKFEAYKNMYKNNGYDSGHLHLVHIILEHYRDNLHVHA